MNKYIKEFSQYPDFEHNNFLKGYYLSKGKLGIEVDYIDMMIGHEYYQKETESIHIYYILEGKGLANINGETYEISKGDTI